MTTARRSRLAASLFVSVLVLLASASPSAARKPAPAPTKAAPAPTACDHPCTHVEDCPKVTCECSQASGSGVAACDSHETHCCADTETACTSFCEMHHQTWTGRFTAEGAAPAAEPSPAASPAAACDETCDKAEDCRTITCECAHGSAENVAACDAKGHCCAGARIVCDHYCTGKKGKWTGKVVETPPPSEPDDGLGEPADDDLYDDDGGGGYDTP